IQYHYANKTLILLENESDRKGYELYFNQIYKYRVMYLQAIMAQCIKINRQIDDKSRDYDNLIEQLSNYKKPTWEDKLIEGVAAMVTSPFRHGFNIALGLANGDSEKVIKSSLILGTSFLGISAIADALDVLDGLDSIDIAESSLEFVDPHERILSDGSTIWVDGDGNTSVDLSKENGGGYYRD
ncbi:hypothetical protein V7068_21185, partial [Bacillus sp. JJ634]